MRSTTRKISAMTDTPQQVDRLCELNVIEQVANVCQTTIVRDAWDRGQELAVHGWVYGLKDGLVRDLRSTRDENSRRLDRLPGSARRALNASSHLTLARYFDDY